MRETILALSEPTTDGTPEAALFSYLRRLERNPYDWRAAHLHPSKLRLSNRGHYMQQVAASEFEPLLERFEGDVFLLTHGDLVVLCKDATVAEMEKVVRRLRYLFSDDPLASAASEDGGEEKACVSDLWTFYDLERQFHDFWYVCEELLSQVERDQSGEAACPVEKPSADTRTLVFAERGLDSVDVAPLLRRQPICAVASDQPLEPKFTEFYISIDELAKALRYDVDFTANRWLFQHLTAALDERLLEAAAAQEGGTEGTPSLNLNIATILSPAFGDFTQKRHERGREEFVVELQLIDVYANLKAYAFARHLVHRRGGMICLDGLHHLHLPLVDRRRLGADYVKVQWSPDLGDRLSEERRGDLRRAIDHADAERVILCRCGSADAVVWGQEMGIGLFQGRYIESRLRGQRPPSVSAARMAMRSAMARHTERALPELQPRESDS